MSPAQRVASGHKRSRLLRQGARTLDRMVTGLAARRGLVVTPKESIEARTADIPYASKSLFEAVRPFTMTSIERVIALADATRYICEANVPGAIVECGVWRGGSMMATATTLLECGPASRDLYLFDTFEGMPDPDEKVDVDYQSRPVSEALDRQRKMDPARRLELSLVAYCPIDLVRRNMETTGYPANKIHYIKGLVEETIPDHAPDQIALLRLDTDWYQSTKHELIHLYPRVSPGGVVIIDDYGHWQGSRKATDEYFSGAAVLLQRIDYSGRLILKR